MHLVHLTASTFYGGPERQMLGLAKSLPSDFRSSFLTFAEKGLCFAFLKQVRSAGFDGLPIEHDTPDIRFAIDDLTRQLRRQNADLLIAHGYKSNVLGRIAARRVGIPVISVSRGWTAENLKVRLYESVDKFHLRYMDAVVCVSQGQAIKVRNTGVPETKIRVIRNAVRLDAFRAPAPRFREHLRQLAGASVNERIVVAAGRLSPEKGFDVLVRAASEIQRAGRNYRFVLFGEGGERSKLEQLINEQGLINRFVLAGFRADLDHFLPWADVVVLPSFTEGLPNVALEASASGTPVVATSVGGTPEVIKDRITGYLVPPGDPKAIADHILEACQSQEHRKRMGEAGRRHMREQFSFEAQAQAYQVLFDHLVGRPMLAAA